MRIRSFIDSAFAMIELHVARLRVQYISLLVALGVVCMMLWYWLFLPPFFFPSGELITIDRDVPLVAIARELEEKNIIHSSLLFVAAARAFGYEDQMQAGKYLFSKPFGTLTVLYRIAHGISGIPPVRLSFGEGVTIREISELLEEELIEFDKETFDREARELEGYMFPDTYIFLPGETPEEIILKFYNNFENQLESIQSDIDEFGKPFPDILTMASIIEREARTLEEKRMIAGILWQRMDIGMALQVDAVFGYIKSIQTYNPSFADLKIDSPYNTYLNKGLPPGPISNPGLESIYATVTPTESPYLYYLTGQDGLMHYATTFEEHKQNRALYLD